MLKKLLRNRTGTAEIVGTVLFLVILLFFFSNVFLWHDQVEQTMDQVIADKINSAVKIGATTGGGEPVRVAHADRYLEYDIDPSGNTSYWLLIKPTYMGRFEVVFTFDTTINTTEKMRLIAAVRLSVNASYEDGQYEECYLNIYDFDDEQWTYTGQTVMQGFRWYNMTVSSPNRYINETGHMMIKFVDSIRYDDNVRGELWIGSLEVNIEPVVLEVTNLGGLDVTLSRLWIVNNTQTANPEKDHIYADLETRIYIWVAAGSRRQIMLSDETKFNSDGSINVTRSDDRIIVHYAPPAGQTVTFRVLTKRANTAACSYHFPHD